MPNTASEFPSTIAASLDALASRGNMTRSRALAAWYATTFLGADEEEALELASIDGGEDQGIDLVYTDHATSQVYVIQAHCPQTTKSATPSEKWNAVVSAIPAFESPDIFREQGRQDLADIVFEIQEEYPDYEVTFGLVSLGKRSDQIRKKLSTTEKSKTLGQYKFFYSSIEDIQQRYQAIVSSDNNVAADKITLKNDFIKNKGKFGEAWIGTAKGSELIRLYKTYGNDLFAGNVRLFIGARKGSINEQTIKTAKENPGIFWALNNGISIVANSVSPDGKDAKGNQTLVLARFSIVNGCQTTSCLAAAEANDAEVLVRIIAASPSVVSDIVRFNNSQNAVRIWAVRSVDDIQNALRAEFKSAGIDYAPKREGTKAKKDPLKIIELDRVTQFMASAHQEFLIQAINGKTELFDQPYQKIFGHGTNACQVYLSWRLGTFSDDARQTRAKELRREGDKVSNSLLGVSATYWINYCAHKLIASSDSTLNAKLKLEKQKSKEFEGALKKYANAALDIYFDIAIDTYDDTEYKSVRSALRSPRFLLKFEQKLNNKLAAKIKSLRLPALGGALSSVKKAT